jgi:hypothetical protein
MAANSPSKVPLLLTRAPMFQSSSGYCRHLRFSVDATGACSVQDQEENRLRSANCLTFIMQFHSPLVHASARFSWYRAAMSGMPPNMIVYSHAYNVPQDHACVRDEAVERLVGAETWTCCNRLASQLI